MAEATELLRWLADDHFTFLGYREYVLDDSTRRADDGRGPERLVAVAGTGLGILRADQPQDPDAGRLPREVSDAGPAAPAAASSPRPTAARRCTGRPTSTTSASSRSTTHGKVVGERRFLGLFTSAAYNESIQRHPGAAPQGGRGARRAAGSASNSHSGKDLLQILETYPRDELFQISADDLARPPRSRVLHLQERRQLRLFLRRDDYGRFMSCMVYLPRDRYTTQVRQAMEEILLDAFDGVSIDYTALVSESVLARLHFVVRVDPSDAVPDVDPAEIEAAAGARDPVLGRRLRRRAARQLRPRGGGPMLASDLRRGVPRGVQGGPARRRRRSPTCTGSRRCSNDGDIDLQLYTPRDAAPGERRLKLFHVGEPVSLSQVLPRLQEMGVEVVDERPYHDRARTAGPAAWVYDFGLRYEPSGEAAGDDAPDPVPGRVRRRLGRRGRERRLQRAGAAGRADLAAGDGAARLREVPAPGRIDVQPGLHRGVPDLQRAHRPAAGALFEARFDPRASQLGGAGPRSSSTGCIEEIAGALDAVASLDQDRILRSFLGAIRATLRTNYFQAGTDGRPKSYVVVQARPAPGARPARSRGRVRDLGLQPAGRGRAPALRPGRARRAALVRPPRGLPHRGARPGQGADGQERRHRAGRRQGRLRRQAAAGRR